MFYVVSPMHFWAMESGAAWFGPNLVGELFRTDRSLAT